MGNGASCPGDKKPICPPEEGGLTLGPRDYSRETTSYVSLGFMNIYMSMEITSSGLLAGIFIGFMISALLYYFLVARKKKMEVKPKEDNGNTTDLELAVRQVLQRTGTPSRTWESMQRTPAAPSSEIVVSPQNGQKMYTY